MDKIICTDINGNKEEVSIDKLSFRPSVYGIVIEDGKILLVKQWDGYDFPGGGVDINETIHEALIREFKEETGLEIKPGKIVLAETSFFKSPGGSFRNSILIYFLCEIVGGQISDKYLSENEKNYAGLAEWISLEDVRNKKMYNSIDSFKVIDEALELNTK